MKRPNLERFRLAAEVTGGNVSKIAGIFQVTRACVYTWTQNAKYWAVIAEERGKLVDQLIESARVSAAGIPIRTEEGEIIAWREKPDSQMLKYLLGTFGRREGFQRENNLNAKVSIDSLSDGQLDQLIRELTEKIKTD